MGAQDKSALTGLEVPAENTPFSLPCGCVCPKHRKRGKGAACGLGDQDWFVLCLVEGTVGRPDRVQRFQATRKRTVFLGSKGRRGAGPALKGLLCKENSLDFIFLCCELGRDVVRCGGHGEGCHGTGGRRGSRTW